MNRLMKILARITVEIFTFVTSFLMAIPVASPLMCATWCVIDALSITVHPKFYVLWFFICLIVAVIIYLRISIKAHKIK